MLLMLTIVASAAEIPLKDQTIAQLLLGNELSFNLVTASFIMAIIGMVTILAIDLQIAIIKNRKKGFKFSFSYWWKDNGARVITNFIISPLIIFAIFRYHGKFSENELSMWLPYSIGAGIDLAIAMVRKFSPFNGFNGVTEKQPETNA